VPFRKYIAELPKPITVMLGMDWKEQHRLDAPRKAYEALGYQVDYPLMWKPWELRPYQDVIREEWGIEPPRLYAMGFPHNNCFAGETRFLTIEGTRRLDEMVGRSTQVLTIGGVYTRADIRSFGKQSLLALRVARRTREKIIYTTAEHRWLVYQDDWSNQRHELITSQLMPGMELVSTFEGGASPGGSTVVSVEPRDAC
jgi:hypothetical protein